MTQYRVEIEISGVVRIEANSPEEAERIGRLAEPMLAGKKIFGPKISSKCAGVVSNHSLSPSSMSQTQATTKPRPRLV